MKQFISLNGQPDLPSCAKAVANSTQLWLNRDEMEYSNNDHDGIFSKLVMLVF